MATAIATIERQIIGWTSIRFFLKQAFEIWFSGSNDDEFELENFLNDRFEQGLFFDTPSSF